MPITFIHTADVHLGKTYRNSSDEAERGEDFFAMLGSIVAAAVAEAVDFVLISGDLFHTGQIMPRTFARTIETLQPLKDAAIPCIAVEGNHDWIHRRDNISWMEALAQMGYIHLLRPGRTESGGYRFEPYNYEQGQGGHVVIKGLNIYGLGYIGAQAGSHVSRICEAVETEHNILLFHVGIWTYSPVEIGNMKPEEAQPLAERFDYVALGHGHKPYIIADAAGAPYAYNPGSPECVNFGEERYDKGYYLVTVADGRFRHRFCPTVPRPMVALLIDLDGCEDAAAALKLLRERVAAGCGGTTELRRPLLELKLSGRVGFHPFELGREQIRQAVDDICAPLHVEIRNNLTMQNRADGSGEQKQLADIEKDVLRELVTARSAYKGREDELVSLALAIRDHVLKGDVEGDELLGLLTHHMVEATE